MQITSHWTVFAQIFRDFRYYFLFEGLGTGDCKGRVVTGDCKGRVEA
jgi:hypothetical protein